MAVVKLSAIAAGSAPLATDTVVGVQSGTTDVQFTLAQVTTRVFTNASTAGVVTFAAGALGAPTIVGVGATTTGIDWPAAGQIRIQISGADKLNYGVTQAGVWSTSTGIVLSLGNQFRIGDAAVAHGLQLIGQSGSDNTVGTLGASEPLVFRTNSVVRARITDTLTIFGAAAAATNAFPALKRSSAILQARLGDDSAFAQLQGILTTDNAATTGLSAGALAATTNASIVLTDATGQAYRIPCII